MTIFDIISTVFWLYLNKAYITPEVYVTSSHVIFSRRLLATYKSLVRSEGVPMFPACAKTPHCLPSQKAAPDRCRWWLAGTPTVVTLRLPVSAQAPRVQRSRKLDLLFCPWLLRPSSMRMHVYARVLPSDRETNRSHMPLLLLFVHWCVCKKIK